jgi:hypothetical protein
MPARGVARPRQPAHLGSDQQAVSPRLCRQPSIVLSQPPQAPVARRSEQGRDLVARGRPVHALDPPAPGIGRLPHPAVRIRQPIACRDVHEDEGVERHLPAPRLQRRHSLFDALVRRCAAIGRSPFDLADQVGVGPRQPGRRPDLRLRHFPALLDARLDPAVAGPQVVTEPAHDQTDPLQVRALSLQLIQRDQQVRPALGVMQVLRRRLRQPVPAQDDLVGQHELARSRDQTDPLQHLLQPVAGRLAEHLETQLRRPVAERPQRQVLEHDIGPAAIGGRRPLYGLDQGVRRLVCGPAVHPHRHPGLVHGLSVGPDPADPVDLAFAQS